MFAESVSALRLKGYRAKCIMVFFFFFFLVKKAYREEHREGLGQERGGASALRF